MTISATCPHDHFLKWSEQRRAALGECEVGYDGDVLGRAEARGAIDAGGVEPAIWLELQRAVDAAADVAREKSFVGDPAFVRGGEVVALDRDGVGQPEDDDRRPADALNLDGQQQAKVGGEKLEGCVGVRASADHLIAFDDHAADGIPDDDGGEGLPLHVVVRDHHGVGLVRGLDSD